MIKFAFLIPAQSKALIVKALRIPNVTVEWFNVRTTSHIQKVTGSNLGICKNMNTP